MASQATKFHIVQRLKTAACADCGQSFAPVAMDFDHMPGTDKANCVAALMTAPLETILAEIKKCELVCSNCHRLRTLRRTAPWDPRLTQQTNEKRYVDEYGDVEAIPGAINGATNGEIFTYARTRYDKRHGSIFRRRTDGFVRADGVFVRLSRPVRPLFAKSKSNR